VSTPDRLAASDREPILSRCEGGWAQGDHDHWFTPWQDALPPGTQSGTYFKSVRTTNDGREIWTYGRVDAETLAAGYVAGGGRRAAV
jgi:hypothetical protein